MTVINMGKVDSNLIMNVLDTGQSIQLIGGGIKDVSIKQRVNTGI